MEKYNLDRFIKAQQQNYNIALSEIKLGKKQSHWIWYIFPQIKGLGHSKTAEYYSIKSMEEAQAYLEDKYLFDNLINICNALLSLESNDIINIMGFPDDLKLCSSMTLFNIVKPELEVFKKVLNKFYDGKLDENTIRICNQLDKK